MTEAHRPENLQGGRKSTANLRYFGHEASLISQANQSRESGVKRDLRRSAKEADLYVRLFLY
jgi:hypothetical protein